MITLLTFLNYSAVHEPHCDCNNNSMALHSSLDYYEAPRCHGTATVTTGSRKALVPVLQQIISENFCRFKHKLSVASFKYMLILNGTLNSINFHACLLIFYSKCTIFGNTLTRTQEKLSKMSSHH